MSDAQMRATNKALAELTAAYEMSLAGNEWLRFERERLQDALRRVRNLNWNWSGPANRNEQGEWVVMKEFEDRMLAVIAEALDEPSPTVQPHIV